jgi:FtsP/CotA-like multicopper oxidase with cupredoxin domain
MRADRDVPRHPRTRSRSPAATRQPGSVQRRFMTTARRTLSRRHCKHQRAIPPGILLIRRLAAELHRVGVSAKPTSDETALLIYPAGQPLPTWVFVGDRGASFCWDSGRRHHPVTEAAGTASALIAWLGGECC